MTYLPKDLVVVPKASLEALTGIVKIESIPLEPLLEDAHRQGWDDYFDGEHRDQYKRDLLSTPIEFKP